MSKKYFAVHFHSFVCLHMARMARGADCLRFVANACFNPITDGRLGFFILLGTKLLAMLDP